MLIPAQHHQAHARPPPALHATTTPLAPQPYTPATLHPKRNFQIPAHRTPQPPRISVRGELAPRNGRFQIPPLRTAPNSEAQHQLWAAPVGGEEGLYYVMGPGANAALAAGKVLVAEPADAHAAPLARNLPVYAVDNLPAQGYVLLEPVSP